MHELPITQAILDQALAAAQRAGAARVLGIRLVIGDLSGLVDESVQFYFDLLSEHTAAHGAALHIERQPAQVQCEACGHVARAAIPLAPWCAACGSSQLHITGGRAFHLESIEIDEPIGIGTEDSQR